jgi:amidase
MNVAEYSRHDGLGLAGLVRNGDVTARELAEVALEAIDGLEPSIAALVDVFREDVQSIPQDFKPEGAFGGVPFIIKDCLLMLEGKPLLNGSRLCVGMTAPHDTDLMRRFSASGVTPVAMSKCPEFGYNATTEPIVSSPVHNPWSRGYSPGGSSGGAAASVAAGYVPIAHGNDGGGSIRIPASCCGLVGLKPTRGRNPLGPDFGEALFGMSCEAILSRTVRDTAMMLECSSGPGSGDPYQTPKPSEGFFAYLEHAPKPLKIAVASAPSWAPAPDPQISEVVNETAAMLERMGHIVIEAEPQFDVEQMSVAISTAWVVGETAWINATAAAGGRTPGPDTLECVMWNIYQEGMKHDAVGALQTIWGGFNATCRSVAPFFESYDVLLTPTVAKTPLRHGALNHNADLSSREWWDTLFDYIPYTPLFNVTGQPAISLPLGVSRDGLPIGIQLAGAFGQEAMLLRLSRQLEIAAPWFARHPATSIWSSGK